MPPKSDDNGWKEWGNHVLAEINRLAIDTKSLHCKIDKLGKDVAKLKIKAGIWGVAAGSLPVGLFILIQYILTK